MSRAKLRCWSSPNLLLPPLLAPFANGDWFYFGDRAPQPAPRTRRPDLIDWLGRAQRGGGAARRPAARIAEPSSSIAVTGMPAAGHSQTSSSGPSGGSGHVHQTAPE